MCTVLILIQYYSNVSIQTYKRYKEQYFKNINIYRSPSRVTFLKKKSSILTIIRM